MPDKDHVTRVAGRCKRVVELLVDAVERSEVPVDLHFHVALALEDIWRAHGGSSIFREIRQTLQTYENSVLPLFRSHEQIPGVLLDKTGL